MKIETHNISLPMDQLDQILGSLSNVLQQMVSNLDARALQKMPDYRNLLIIDENRGRAEALTSVLIRAGYRPLLVASALEAFTRFLQVPFVPFAIILSQDEPSNTLFLQRLLQQTAQKYRWDIPLIRLHYQSSAPASQRLQTSPSRSLTPFLSPSPQQSPLLTDNALSQPLPSISPTTSSAPLPPLPSVQPPQPSMPGLAQTPPPFISRPSGSLVPANPTTGPISQEFRISSSPLEDPAKAVPKISLEGQNIGRYHINSLLGDSASSNVYKTYDRLREAEIALKAVQTDSLPYHLMKASLEEYNLFQQEADLLRNIEHPHVVKVWNSGKSYVSGVSFIYKTLQYFPDGSLVQWLFQRGGEKVFSAKEVNYIVVQLAEALQYLHDRKITFQNFKLSNLLLRKPARNMSQLHLMLADFAAPQDGSFFPKSQQSLAYIAPERWFGQVSPASDQYGLAIIAYELLTGRLPFQGNSAHIMQHLHTTMQPQPPSSYNRTIPTAIDSVILRALAKRPEERFASAALFAQTFQKYCG